MPGIVEIRPTGSNDLGPLADYILDEMADFVDSIDSFELITGTSTIFSDGTKPVLIIKFEDVQFATLDEVAIQRLDQVLVAAKRLGLELTVTANGKLFRQSDSSSGDQVGKKNQARK